MNNTPTTSSVSIDNSNRVFDSITQCASATGYDKKVIKQAKASGAPGFTQSNRIIWRELEPWLITNKTAVESAASHSLEYYKTEIAARDVVLRDLEIQRKKEESISPDEIKHFLSSFGTLLSSALKQKRQELMSKVTGYESVIDKEFVDLFKLVNKELDSFLNK